MSPAMDRSDRGSVLMLMPAAVLIVVILGAMAVDRAVVFGAQRDLIATAQAAANDAASLGVSIDHLRSDGEVEADIAAMEAAVDTAMVAAEPGTTVSWWLEGDEVVVELARDVALVFSPGVPGAPRSQEITARASAELRLSDP
ncbi:MAG: hypothetical protein GX643_13525 [Acidimicrobiales bacterium]|nr:hypothetical protein [Acidimicrobiales bacterium]